MWIRLGIIFLLLIPFVDLYILVSLAGIIGFWETLALIVITGLIGAEFIRREGRYVLLKLQSSVSMNEVSRNMVEGVLLVLCGLMLLSPGIVTDILGFIVAFRPFRERIAAKIMNNMDYDSNVEIRTFSF